MTAPRRHQSRIVSSKYPHLAQKRKYMQKENGNTPLKVIADIVSALAFLWFILLAIWPACAICGANYRTIFIYLLLASMIPAFVGVIWLAFRYANKLPKAITTNTAVRILLVASRRRSSCDRKTAVTIHDGGTVMVTSEATGVGGTLDGIVTSEPNALNDINNAAQAAAMAASLEFRGQEFRRHDTGIPGTQYITTPGPRPSAWGRASGGRAVA
jgi:hypothetical protein